MVDFLNKNRSRHTFILTSIKLDKPLINLLLQTFHPKFSIYGMTAPMFWQRTAY